MVASLGLAGLALRSGLALRRSRAGRAPRTADQRRRHLRLAKPAAAMVLVGFGAGIASWLLLRDGEPFETLHGWIGLLAAALFATAAVLGRRIETGRARAFDAHALCGGLGLLAGALAAVAGFTLLP